MILSCEGIDKLWPNKIKNLVSICQKWTNWSSYFKEQEYLVLMLKLNFCNENWNFDNLVSAIMSVAASKHWRFIWWDEWWSIMSSILLKLYNEMCQHLEDLSNANNQYFPNVQLLDIRKMRMIKLPILGQNTNTEWKFCFYISKSILKLTILNLGLEFQRIYIVT